MKSRVLILAFVAASFLPMVVLAHHSFTATYDTAKTVTIEGKVTQFLLRNPHSFLHIVVIDKDGKAGQSLQEHSDLIEMITGELGSN